MRCMHPIAVKLMGMDSKSKASGRVSTFSKERARITWLVESGWLPETLAAMAYAAKVRNWVRN